MDSLALATIFFMREGIPGKLRRSKFLSANLPDLGRLRTYGIQISHFTVRVIAIISHFLRKTILHPFPIYSTVAATYRACSMTRSIEIEIHRDDE